MPCGKKSIKPPVAKAANLNMPKFRKPGVGKFNKAAKKLDAMRTQKFPKPRGF